MKTILKILIVFEKYWSIFGAKNDAKMDLEKQNLQYCRATVSTNTELQDGWKNFQVLWNSLEYTGRGEYRYTIKDSRFQLRVLPNNLEVLIHYKSI